MISQIVFDQTNYQDFATVNTKDGVENQLENLGRLNIFIGENNSGKSRFLRSLFVDEDIEIKLKGLSLNYLFGRIKAAEQVLTEYSSGRTFLQGNEIESEINKIVRSISFKKSQIARQANSIIDFISRSRSIQNIESILQRSPRRGDEVARLDGVQYLNLMKSTTQQLYRSVGDILSAIKEYGPINLYIPILRGLRPIQTTDNKLNFNYGEDNYKHRTKRDYFFHDKIRDAIKDEEIFTGLDLYKDVRDNLLSHREKREKIKKFEDFLSKNFFSNKTVSLIPHIENDVLHIGIGDEDERAIYDLGDGIQSLIILLYPLFMRQGENTMVFIEEPELSLHPGMQRIFIEALLKPEFNSFQYFITTHSNHFLDITLDSKEISVYTFQKKQQTDKEIKYHIQNTSNSDLQILDLIGARSSSVFLSNCTIWVEGITDRLYLKKYLEVYQNDTNYHEKNKPKYREDIHFSFVEYGGGNVVHWAFSDADNWETIKTSSISKKIYLIADSDNTKVDLNSKKGQRIKQFQQNMGKNFRLIDGREIENTISETVLIKTIRSFQTGDNEVEFDTGRVTYSKYKNKPIGTFIENTFKNTSRSYKATSGTIKNKVAFCHTAISHIESTTDLSEEGLKLAKDIFDFIKRSNE